MNLRAFTAKDSADLLQFSLIISETSDNIFQKTLSLLKDVFSFHSSFYVVKQTLTDGGLTYSDFFSYTVPRSFLEEMRDLYLNSKSIHPLIKSERSKSLERVIFSQDTNSNSFWRSKYIEHRNKYSYNNSASFTVGSNPSVDFIILKTFEEGEFSKDERNILEYISRFLNDYVNKENRYNNILYSLMASDEIFDSLKTGRIIVSKSSFFSHHNSYYEKLAEAIDPTKTVNAFTSWLLGQVEFAAGGITSYLSEPVTIKYNDHQITAVSKTYSGYNYSNELFYVITIQHTDNRSFEIDPKVINQANLSRREIEIAQLIICGKTYPQIAEDLHLSLSTAKTHVYNIFSKIGVNNKTEAIKVLTGRE